MEEDKHFSSRLSIRLEKILMRRHKMGPSKYTEKVHYRNVWKDKQDAVSCVNLAHAQDLDLHF